MEIQGKIKLLKSNQVDSSGVAVAPLASELEFGQIAVNYSALNPSLFFKDANGKVVKIVTEEVIADTLADILGGSAADLSTLKELLDAFATSDIATVQADVLKRLSAVETGKVDKVAGKGLSTNDYTNADKAHMTNTSNPHGVTKAQVGLGNVLDKEQLGKTETAAAATKLGTNSVLSGSVNIHTDNRMYQLYEGVTDAPVTSTNGCKMLALKWDENAASQMFFEHNTDDVHIRRKAGTWQQWRKLWHSGNSNLSTVDWSAASLHACTANPALTVYDTNKSKKSYFGWVDVHGTYMSNVASTKVIGIKDDGTPHYSGHELYHTGNSNKLTINWAANVMNANSFVGTDLALSGNAFIQKNQVWHAGNNLFANKANTDLNTIDATKWSTTSITSGADTLNAPMDYVNMFNLGSSGSYGGSVQLASYYGNANIFYMRGWDDRGYYKNWVQLFHTGNINKSDVDFTCKNLVVDGYIKRKSSNPFILFNATNLADTWDYAMTDGAFYPVTNKFALGTASNQWGSVHCGNVFFNELYSGNLHFGSIHQTNKILTLGTTATGLDKINFECGGGLYANLTKAGLGVTTNISAGANISAGGNVTAKGDVVAYSATSNVRIEPTVGGASNLFDLGDVELPTTLTNNYVLAYDASKKKWTAKESVGTGGAKVDYDRLTNLPTTFTPKPHNHEDATYVSDVRLKQNINPLDNALNTVLALDAKSFGWTTEAKERYNMKDEVSYGYIAQDVEKIIPDIVKELETGDGYIGVEYIKVIPFITEAIKQLHFNTIESNLNLKKELNKMNKVYSSLFNDYKQLKAELAALKAR